jgi:transcriptional regulator with XRE-family HTH domain
MKNIQENTKQLPEMLYNAAALRAGKGAKDWTIEKIMEESEAIGLPLAYGTVQSTLKGTGGIPDLTTLWTLALVLDVPMYKIFQFESEIPVNA